MSLAVYPIAALLMLACAWVLVASFAPPAPRHRRHGLARLPLGVQLLAVALIATAVINHAQPGVTQ